MESVRIGSVPCEPICRRDLDVPLVGDAPKSRSEGQMSKTRECTAIVGSSLKPLHDRYAAPALQCLIGMLAIGRPRECIAIVLRPVADSHRIELFPEATPEELYELASPVWIFGGGPLVGRKALYRSFVTDERPR